MRNLALAMIITMSVGCDSQKKSGSDDTESSASQSRSSTQSKFERSSLPALANSGIKALKSGDLGFPQNLFLQTSDVDAMVRLCDVPADQRQTVKEKSQKQFERIASQATERFRACQDLVPDWSKAVEIERNPNGNKDKSKCAAMTTHPDYSVIFRVGQRIVDVELDDPFEFQGQFYAEHLSCRDITDVYRRKGQ